MCTVGKPPTRQLALRSRDGLVCDLLYESTKTTKLYSVCLRQLFTTVLFTYSGYLTCLKTNKRVTADKHNTA